MNLFDYLFRSRRAAAYVTNEPSQVSTGKGNTGPIIDWRPVGEPQRAPAPNVSQVATSPALEAPGMIYNQSEANQHTFSYMRNLRSMYR